MFWGHGVTIFSTIAPFSWFCFFVHIFLFTRNYFPVISFLWKCLSSSFMQLKFHSSMKLSLIPKVEVGVTFPMTCHSQRHYAIILLYSKVSFFLCLCPLYALGCLKTYRRSFNKTAQMCAWLMEETIQWINNCVHWI